MRAVTLLLPLLFAGCFGECGPYDTLRWRDASLYEAMAGVEHRSLGAPAGLANGSALNMSGATVTTFTWRPAEQPQDREFAQVRLEVGKLTAQATSEEEARAIITAFVADLSAADDATSARMVDAILANKTDGVGMYEPANDTFRTVAWEYNAQLAGPWRVDAILREQASNASTTSAEVGGAQVQVGPYVALIAFPVREATLDGIPFRVDAAGSAEAFPGERGGGTQQDSIERVRAALAARGLPPPGDVDVRTLVC